MIELRIVLTYVFSEPWYCCYRFIGDTVYLGSEETGWEKTNHDVQGWIDFAEDARQRMLEEASP